MQEILSLIVEHVSAMGWEACCWSDDALSSKKLYPKYQFPAKTQKWLSRVRTSEDSMRLLWAACTRARSQVSVPARVGSEHRRGLQ